MTVHEAAQSFGQSADAYVRGRPEYPADMLDWMVAVTGIHPGDVVVELGAGTGKFTQALVGLGAHVTAVEPVDGMRAQLQALLPEVTALGAMAQDLPIERASTNLVACAQSFHWFANEEAIAEIARVLKPGGHLVLVWNQRDLRDPIQAKFGDLLDRFQDDAVPHSPTRRWKPAMDETSLFVEVEERYFANDQELPRERVADRLRSMSFFAGLTDEQKTQAAEELDAVVPNTETVIMRYINEAFAYRRVD